MKRILAAAALAVAMLLPATVAAQSVGLAGRAGTLGLGGEVNLDLNRWIGVRGGIGSIPVQPSATFGQVKYTIKPPSSLSNIGVDVYPGGWNFRLSGGLLFKHDIALDAEPTQEFEIGNGTYTPDQVGTLTAAFAYNSTAPYASFGFAGRGRGIGLSMDFGAAFMGKPAVALNASGPIFASGAFQGDLREEELTMQDKANKYMKILPIISLALRFGI